jgi:hypothetical protein
VPRDGAAQLKEFRMIFAKQSTTNAQSAKPAEKPTRVGREDGEANVVDVPQADGDSAVKPADAVQPAAKPVKTVDNRANGWRGR